VRAGIRVDRPGDGDLPAQESDLERHLAWISAEVLASEVSFDGSIADPVIAKRS
jgi:hypothetical protein